MTESHDQVVFPSVDEYLHHLGAINHNTVDAITILDTNGCHAWCNDIALEMFGFESQEEIQGWSIRKFINQDYVEDYMKTLERVRSGEKILLQDVSYLAIRKDGTTFPAHSRAVPIYIDGKFVGIHSVTRDLSEINENEHRLRISLSAIDLMASLIQHDMRNELHVIENALVLATMTNENPETNEYISIAESGLHRIKSLLKVMAPTISEDSEDLENVIIDSLSHIKEMHPDVGAIYERPREMQSLKINERRLLAFVFDNLFRNSIKYAGSESKIFVRIDVLEDMIQIDIVDDGPGISEEMKRVLFTRGATTSGTGLGLYICKRIVEGYNGKINLMDSSRHGDGAAFRITLPVEIPDL